MKLVKTVFLLLAMCWCAAFAQETQTAGPYMIQVAAHPDPLPVGKSVPLDAFVMDAKSMAPISGLTLKASLTMPAMAGMAIEPPKVKASGQPGHYKIALNLPMAGDYSLGLSVQSKNQPTTNFSFSLKAGAAGEKSQMGAMPGMSPMNAMQMKGDLGDWPMSREGSGTSWQPDSSPMHMLMLPAAGRYDLSFMGQLQAGYVDAGGKRGEKQDYSNSMFMWMAQRDTGDGRLALHLMMSLDALTNGERGVPNLFQTGETAHGQPLVDRQHPHDLFDEISASYSKPVRGNDRAFLYAAPVGEPALGNTMFMMRPSGMEIPEAPISHHWFDSTHISFGVVTAGYVIADKWKFEASAFNGREPNENRYDIEPMNLKSSSGRITYNPDSNWSLSASYGFLRSPEALDPLINQHRLTASATYNRPFSNGDNFASTAYFGQLIVAGQKKSNAFAWENTLSLGRDSLFERFERVDKDELVGVPAGSYTINKLLFGDVHNVEFKNGFEYGLGAYVGVYSFPKSLDQFYGSHPLTWGVFLRIRPQKM